MVKVKHCFILLLTIFAISISATNIAELFCLNNLVFADATITSTWDENYITNFDNVFTSGTGQQDDPYIIDTANQFATIKSILENGDDSSILKYNTSSVFYKLNANINLNNKYFNGIGIAGRPFKANFDGNNCTISNFRYRYPDESSPTVNAGLFNSIEGTIKNLNVSNARFTINLTDSTNLYCGVLIGYQNNGSTIEHISVDSSTLTISLGGSLTQVMVGGVVGKSFNNTQIVNASCQNTTININLSAVLDGMEILSTGLIAGSVQTRSFVKDSYCGNQNSITINQLSTNLSDATSYVGGIAGILALNAEIEKCFSNFTNLTLTTNNQITNNIGGIVGYVKESNIKNVYAKNNLFISAISSNNTSTNNIGGLVGYAEVTSNLINSSNGMLLLSQCYAVVDTQTDNDFGSASVGATIGLLNLNSFSQTTLQNAYYIPKNSQTLTDYNVANGSKYSGENIITQLNDTSAKNLNNYNGFDDSIWCNDLSEPINDGYPILMGVGNNIVPAQKQSYTITIKSQIIDELGTSELTEIDTKVIEESATDTYQITPLQNHSVEVQTQNGKVDAQFDGSDLITISNVTGDDTIIIVFTKDSYTVTLEVAGNVGGTLDFATGYSSKVYYGGSTSIVVATADGYKFDFATGVALSNASLTATQTAQGFSVANITSNLTITVTFIRVYTINLNIYQTDETGTNLIEETAVEIEENGTGTYQIELQQNYNISSAQPINGRVVCTIGSNGLLTFSEATGDDTIDIVIAKVSYTVTLTVAGGVGGTLDFASDYSSKVYYGGSTSIVVAAADGYRFDLASCVVLSDASLTATQTADGFSVANITSNLTITVTFIRVYTINLNIYQTDETGTNLIEETAVEIEENGTGTYQIELQQNYNISSAQPINGRVVCTIGSNGLLTLSNATGDDTIDIVIAKDSYTVTLTVAGGVGGTLSFATGYSSKVYYGGSTSIVVATADGYRFDFATGVALSDTNLTTTQTAQGFSVDNITSNLTITVTFIRVYTINLNIYQTDETGTNLIKETSVEIEENGTGTYQIELQQNYNVSSVQPINGRVVCTIGSNGLLTFSEATGDDTIDIVIAKDSYTVTLTVAGGVGGTLDFAAGYSSKVYYGGSTSIVVATADGYRFDLASCVVLSDTNLTTTQAAEGFSVDSITSNLTITVTFIKTYQVTVYPNDSSMGLVSDNNTDFGNLLNLVVDSGESVTLYAQTNENTHLFARWKTVQGTELGTNLTLSVTVASDMEIIAEFKTKYYSIDIQITNPSGNANNVVKINNEEVKNGQILADITYNQNINLSFATDENCYVDSISINSSSLTSEQIESGSYTFVLQTNTTISVVFANYININVYAYSNTLADSQSYTNTDEQNYVGFAQNPTTISQTTKIKADYTVTLYAVANEKYIFDGWFDTNNFENATAISTSTQFALSQAQMQTLRNIYAKFSIDTYEITIKQTLIDENGTNTRVLDTRTSEYKGSLDYNIVKPQNYNFVNIESNCGAVYDQTTQKITISNILSGDVVTITFEKQKFALTLNVGTGGQATIDGQVVTTINDIYYNTSKQIEVLASDGYRFDKDNGANISGTCTSNITKPTDSVEQYIINLSNITSDVTIDISFIKTYVVTISTNINVIGKVSFDDTDYQNNLTLIVDAGSNLTVYAQVATGSELEYEFKRWTDDTNAEVSTDQQYDISDIQTDVILTAVFAKIGYSFTIQVVQEVANANNVVTVNGTTVNQNYQLDGQDYGTTINIAYTEYSGSYLEKVVVSSVTTGDLELTKDNFAGNSYQFSLLDNISAIVYFKAYKFDLNLSATNGSLTFDDDSTTKTVTAYDTVDIIATANTGYEYQNLSGDTSYFNYSAKDDNDIITLSGFTTTGEKTTTLNITATFAILQYKIIVNYGANGSVLINQTPIANGAENIYDYGTPLTLSFVANNEYYLNSVKQNGADITSQLVENQFIVPSLQEDLIFEVDFGIKKYNLSVTNDFADVSIIIKANGSNTTETYFESGTYIELFASCPLGYNCKGFYKQNQLLNAGYSYDFYIYEDTDIFAEIVAEISVEQSANGYVTIDGGTSGTYGYGEKVLVQVTPDLGYQFASFENNIVLDENNYLTVDKTLTIKAVFESKPVEVTLNCDQNGTINSNINGTYYIGEVLTLSLTNNVGYHFAGYTGTFAGELLNELQTTYTILPQDAENGRVEIFANFAIDTFNVYITSNYGGSVTPYGESQFDYGALLQIDIEVYDKYQIGSVLVNDVEQSSLIVDGKINLQVYENYDIEIEFSPICWVDFAQKPQGNGTSDNPFIIKTAEELAFIAKAINSQLENAGGQIRYDYAYYKLANDIDLDGKFWTPIGTMQSPFNGIFDFNYFKIKNLYTQNNDADVYSYGGLFDVIGEHGKVINQYKNNLVLIIFIISGTVVLILLILLVVFIEKRNRKPKRVIVLPSSMADKTTKIDNKSINKPDISKLLKK